MANLLPNETVCNIFARLPAKPLLRMLCLSKYWNRVLREPYFMNLRSRTTIILPQWHALHLINDDDTPHSILELTYPFETGGAVNVIGTFNGIVLLACPLMLILYNPLTGESERLPEPPVSRYIGRGIGCRSGYGFGYGANTDDLKIVKFRQHTSKYDVYSFKTNRWSSRCTLKFNIKCIRFDSFVGKFVNGFLHWIAYHRNVLTVLNVKDLVLSEIRLPFKRKCMPMLGTIYGCLCSLDQRTNIFDIWVMKEYGVENSWWKKYSFTLPIGATLNRPHYAISILNSGKILMMDPLREAVIYDVLKDSYTRLNISLNHANYPNYGNINGAEYVESLISPLDICSSKLKMRRKRKREVAI